MLLRASTFPTGANRLQPHPIFILIMIIGVLIQKGNKEDNAIKGTIMMITMIKMKTKVMMILKPPLAAAAAKHQHQLG